MKLWHAGCSCGVDRLCHGCSSALAHRAAVLAGHLAIHDAYTACTHSVTGLLHCLLALVAGGVCGCGVPFDGVAAVACLTCSCQRLARVGLVAEHYVGISHVAN